MKTIMGVPRVLAIVVAWKANIALVWPGEESSFTACKAREGWGLHRTTPESIVKRQCKRKNSCCVLKDGLPGSF